MLQILYEIIDKNRSLSQWIISNFCEILWKQIHRFNEDIDRILTMISVINDNHLPTPSNSLRSYLLGQNLSIGEYLHLLIKFLLVILEMDHYSIRFSLLLTILLPTILV
jgi:hypothetical protein